MELSAPTSSVKELKEIAVDSIDFVVNGVKKDWQEFATKYNFAFKEYFEAKSKTLSKIKPIFSSQSIDLREIYVPQNIVINSAVYRFSEINETIEDNKKLILLGTAGAGKSCLSKSFFLETIQSKFYFPIFYELRKLNETGKTIFDSLVDDIAVFNSKFSKENLDYVLRRKSTLLILDGFDEVNFDKKKEYFKEITKLAESYPDLKFIVSSRAEEGLFSEWNLFSIANLQSLNLQQACEVISKLDYDSEVKQRFLKSLKKTLFRKHNDFASNPLLLTIMLFTYEQNGNIPEQMHIFYEQAYQAIFNRHDSYKQGFVRKSLTNLDMQKFRVVFALFSLTTYLKEQFEFSTNEFENILKKCLEATQNSNVSPYNMKRELLSNVPLIMQDGINFCFSHRSFQEYFTAFYLVYKQDLDLRIFEKLSKRLELDNVLPMAFDMNKSLLENKWILPTITRLLSEVQEGESIEIRFNNTLKFHKGFWVAEEHGEWRFLLPYSGETSTFLNFIQNRYQIKNLSNNPNDSQSVLQEIVEEFGDSSVKTTNFSSEQKKRFIELNCDWKVRNYISILKKVKNIIEESQERSITEIEDLLFGG